MPFLYSFLLTFAVAGAIPYFLVQGIRGGNPRAALRERLGLLPPFPPGTPTPVWIQAVSVGEVLLARRLLAELASLRPDLAVLLTTSTTTGRRIAAATASAGERVGYFPVDHPLAIRNALRRLRPRALVLVETEIWPNLLGACDRAGIPVALVNGRISARTYPRYRRLRTLFGPALQGVRLCLMQSEEEAARIRELGAPPDRVRVGGNAKWDLPPPPPGEAIRRRLGVEDSTAILVAGSTGPGEEAALLDAWERTRATFAPLRLVLAPRHRERFSEVGSLLERRGIPFARRSRSETLAGAPVLLLDTLGELREIYAAGTVCFVGGSLFPGRGGQNLAEPAACGRPVLFGPHTENFSGMARELIASGGGFRVADAAGAAARLESLLGDERGREEAGRRARELVQRNRGAARRAADALAALIPAGTSR